MQLESKKIILRDKLCLYCEFRENGSTTWIIATHGVGEHLGRHKFLVDLFAQDFNVFTYDLRGHGRSDGKRGLIEDIDDATKDLAEIIEYLKKEYGMKRYILFGHSLGAMITADYIQNYASEDLYPERVFLSSPPVSVPGFLSKLLAFPSLETLANLKSAAPSINLKGLVDLNNLSHDPLVKDAYINDELNNLSLNLKTGLGIVHASRRIFARPLRCECPLYVICGSFDHIVGPECLEAYFTNIEKSAILKMVRGGYHELHNEIDEYREEYIEFIKESIMSSLYHHGL